MARSYVKDADRGAKALLRRLEIAGGIAINVGLVGAKARAIHSDSDITVEELGLLHELGLGMPRRSWCRGWLDENEARVIRDLRAGIAEIRKGGDERTPREIAQSIGDGWALSMAERIREGDVKGPPLAEETIARKGHDRQLDDTGQLADAIECVIGKGLGRAL